MGKKVTLSTGVLRREPATVSAVINLVNLDDCEHDVTVEVELVFLFKPGKTPCSYREQ